MSLLTLAVCMHSMAFSSSFISSSFDPSSFSSWERWLRHVSSSDSKPLWGERGEVVEKGRAGEREEGDAGDNFT